MNEDKGWAGLEMALSMSGDAFHGIEVARKNYENTYNTEERHLVFRYEPVVRERSKSGAGDGLTEAEVCLRFMRDSRDWSETEKAFYYANVYPYVVDGSGKVVIPNDDMQLYGASSLVVALDDNGYVSIKTETEYTRNNKALRELDDTIDSFIAMQDEPLLGRIDAELSESESYDD